MSEQLEVSRELNVSLEIVAECNECGKPLSVARLGEDRETIVVCVEPCEHCLSSKYDEGYQDSQEEKA